MVILCVLDFVTTTDLMLESYEKSFINQDIIFEALHISLAKLFYIVIDGRSLTHILHHFQVFDIFRAREFEGRFVCEFLNNCDRPEVFEPPITVQRPEPSKHQKQRNVVVPDDALKVAMVTDVHVEPRYTEV